MSLSPDRLTTYLARVGLDAPPAPDAHGLASLQAAHRASIAFESLDVRLNRPILIDSDSVFDKLVTRRRGGYCFEQNRLFADMLALIGLPSRPLLARVRLGAPAGEVTPRTHALLLLDVAGEPWIADAGFGANDGPPLPLRDGATTTTGDGTTHRLRKIGQRSDISGEWLIERISATDTNSENWQPQYAFDLLTVAQIDLEQCNHWTSTSPDSRFMTWHIVSIVLPDGFASMVDRQLTITRSGSIERCELTRASDYHAMLTDIFGVRISADDVAALPLFARA